MKIIRAAGSCLAVSAFTQSPPLAAFHRRVADAACGWWVNACGCTQCRPIEGTRSVVVGWALALLCALALPAAAVEPADTAGVIVDGTNALREGEGLEPLARNDALAAAARAFAGYMARTGRYGHTADGRQPTERAGEEGYAYCVVAENIGYQYRSPDFPSAQALGEAFVEGWKNSPGHRENMLDPNLREIGVGVAQGEGGRHFGVQLFGRPKDAAIRFEVRNESGRPLQYTLEERSYALAPRSIRAHVVCRPTKLDIVRPAFRAQATDGARYVVGESAVRTR